ncbi:hypothetical protein OG455_00560 [Kitasatospora sp. NBC_01287]|uniref:hypothetical protein n=1 Tax=Kitasatospora sp. NBC_01287 TaxID=2903573 RepID=UPI002258584A|nr:hypothetical protein [Kitasatospora sp. NBC_01287]MCX4744017.1 hypothetical protein [Kitasatospora sp. NBC_01287]
MPFTETSPQDEFAVAVEWVADRVLGALTGAGDVDPPRNIPADGHPDAPAEPATAAALRVLGPDLFAPGLFTGMPIDAGTATALAEAGHRFGAFEPPGRGPDELVVGWRDWATAELLTRAGWAVPVHRPDAVPPAPDPLTSPSGWQPWSVRMSQLAPLALPGLDSPVHEQARQAPLALARGATRSVLRRDHRTAARLARWLAWLQATGTPVPIEVAPLLRHLAQVGGGSARTTLDLEIARRLPAGEPSR